LLEPRWWLLHGFTVGSIFAMLWLGRWQWHAASRHHGELRNYAYALQWWAFTLFAALMWYRIVHDHLVVSGRVIPAGRARPVAGPVTPPRYIAYTPPSPGEPDDDPERARFNAYLAALDAADRRPDGSVSGNRGV